MAILSICSLNGFIMLIFDTNFYRYLSIGTVQRGDGVNPNECNIGQRIYDLRIERDIQQGELAKAIHIHQSVLNRIEKGTRPARDSEICALASFFKVSADNLLGLTTVSPVSSVSSIETISSPALKAKSATEAELLTKFRILDRRGQQTVLNALRNEYDFIMPSQQQNNA